MTDLHDVITAARPTPTYIEVWRTRQRRTFITLLVAGGILFFVGLGLLTRPDRNPAVGVWTLAIGLLGILVAGWFGLRAIVGEPPEA